MRTAPLPLILLVALIAAFAAAGSDHSPGPVLDRGWSADGGTYRYYVTVQREHSGVATEQNVSESAYTACTVGTHWPECAR